VTLADRLVRSAARSHSRLAERLLWLQGGYYLASGLWPIVSLASFERVTGPKTDDWLVRTVAVLIVAIATTLLFAAWRGRAPREIAVLACASAIALTAIDGIYVTLGVIPPIYLADAAVELGLLAAWSLALRRSTADD
jgi:hypothetical protein